MVPLAWVVLGLLAAHDVTHVLDDGLETPLWQLALVALPQWLFLAATMAVVLRGDARQSRAAAMLLGLSVAVGFAAIHLLPVSPAAYWDLEPSWVSWVLVWAPTIAALALVVVSRSAAGASRGTPPSPRARRASGWTRP